MKKKQSKIREQQADVDMVIQNENFYFIAGYTSNNVPYGTTSEEAHEAELVEDKEIDDSEYPF